MVNVSELSYCFIVRTAILFDPFADRLILSAFKKFNKFLAKVFLPRIVFCRVTGVNLETRNVRSGVMGYRLAGGRNFSVILPVTFQVDLILNAFLLVRFVLVEFPVEISFSSIFAGYRFSLDMSGTLVFFVAVFDFGL